MSAQLAVAAPKPPGLAEQRIAQLFAEVDEWDGDDADELEETLWVLFAYVTTHPQARARGPWDLITAGHHTKLRPERAARLGSYSQSILPFKPHQVCVGCPPQQCATP